MIELASMPAKTYPAAGSPGDEVSTVRPSVHTVLPSGQPAAPISAIWSRVPQLAELGAISKHALIQTADDVGAVSDTVRSIAAVLSTAGGCVEVVGGPEAASSVGPLRVRDVSREEHLGLVGLGSPARLTVPTLWFERVCLVTVVGLAVDGTRRFRGILDAQSAPLRRLGNPHSREQLAYEAHRLAASDLCVVCAYRDRDHQPLWWAISRSDVELDSFVCRLAGLNPAALPTLRELIRHEVLPEAGQVVGPELPRCATARIRPGAALDALGRMRAVARASVAEWTVIRKNVHRIPHAVRRRLARFGRS